MAESEGTMSKIEQGEPEACRCGNCFFLAMDGSKYCVAHRSSMEAYDRMRAHSAASLPESQPAQIDLRCAGCGELLQLGACDETTWHIERHSCQPAPEMDSIEEIKGLFAMLNLGHSRSMETPNTDIIIAAAWLRAHDARVQPSRTCCIGGNGMNGHHPQCDRAINNLSPNVMPSQPSSVAGTERLREALNRSLATIRFFASVIKSGERWSLTCQEALEQMHKDESALKESSRGK